MYQCPALAELCCQDGTRRKDWQHYAALMAASVAKCIIENIPHS